MNPYELELSFTQVPHKHGFLVLQISRNSQFGPENPVGQTHLYESEVVIQRPLFLHGFKQHLSVFGSQPFVVVVIVVLGNVVFSAVVEFTKTVDVVLVDVSVLFVEFKFEAVVSIAIVTATVVAFKLDAVVLYVSVVFATVVGALVETVVVVLITKTVVVVDFVVDELTGVVKEISIVSLVELPIGKVIFKLSEFKKFVVEAWLEVVVLSVVVVEVVVVSVVDAIVVVVAVVIAIIGDVVIVVVVVVVI